MIKQKVLEQLLEKRKTLWADYLNEKETRKAGKILKLWSETSDIILAVQEKITSLFLNELSDDYTTSSVQQTRTSVRSDYMTRKGVLYV